MYHIAIALPLVLSGCASETQVSVQSVSRLHFSPSTTVQVFSKVPDNRPFIVIAKLAAEGPAGTPSSQVLAALEKKAAALGADAIVLRNDSQKTAPVLQYNPSGGTYNEPKSEIIPRYTAKALRWLEANPKH
ncbi:MAG: hypothetical protein PHO57_11610 [Acidithiobacillus sp.]|nr:hypothetical protein [Acidithiobacillus sp.]